MRGRCNTPSAKGYEDYGGRGIAVCERWALFPVFLADMGPCPPGYSLDRIDVNGDYTPENCRWASLKTQHRNRRDNRRLTAFGETKTAAEWAEDPRCLASYGTLLRRVNGGLDAETAMRTPSAPPPKRYDEQVIAEARRLHASGVPRPQIAIALGISLVTAYRYTKELSE